MEDLSQKVCGKHLGGVAQLRLYDATKLLPLDYDPASESFEEVWFDDGGAPVEVAFVEGSGVWSERGVTGGVEHSVAFELQGVRTEALEGLRKLSEGGLVAEIVDNEGAKFLVGYSLHAAAEYPLRLSSAESSTGGRRGERPTTRIVLTSRDGWYAHRLKR